MKVEGLLMRDWPLWRCGVCGFETAREGEPRYERGSEPAPCESCAAPAMLAFVYGDEATRYRLFLRLLGLPTMERNARRHHRARADETARWRSAVAFAALGKTPGKPLERAYVRLCRHSESEPDPTNNSDGFKAIEDGIVGAGILVDDKSRYYAQGRPVASWAWAPARKGFVSVLIEDATLGGSDGN